MSVKQTLVRARLKRIEDLPEWAKCCSEFLEYVGKNKDRIVALDLKTASDVIESYCKFCGATVDGNTCGKSVHFADVGIGCLAFFDLDEGPIS